MRVGHVCSMHGEVTNTQTCNQKTRGKTLVEKCTLGVATAEKVNDVKRGEWATVVFMNSYRVAPKRR